MIGDNPDTSDYKAYQTYKNYALKMIPKLEKIELLGKTKTPVKDIVTTSSVKSILVGLGDRFPELTSKLEDLMRYAFTASDMVNLHKKGKVDVHNWKDTSFDGIISELKKLRLENAEMAQSDVNKIIKYSGELQNMFSVEDNLEDWVKAKLNHACDYVATVRDYLKFYRDEKETGTADDQIDEKWSNKYKKTINCSNPKGFSQKAHCRARRLRQVGQHTKSKPVREIYKEVTSQLLKEFNSSMAMGALKQLNNDAKELEGMLQPNFELEDWVKAKLNLAGEYLDDVYHHLDHFGPEGRTLDEGYDTKKFWFTPAGKVIDAGHSHEEWIKNNDRSLMGATLVDTYENAIDKGYVRAIYDIGSGFVTLSNLPNYDFSMSKLSRTVKQAIEDFVVDKEIRLVATGKGKLIKDFQFSFAEQLELAEQILNSKNLKEGWKDWVAAGAIGLGAMTGKVDAAKTSKQPAITQSVQKSVGSFIDYIKKVENQGKAGYNAEKKLWFPHASFEGGSDTIGYGHKIQKGEDFSKGITDAQAEDLLKKDLAAAKQKVYRELGNIKLTPQQEEMFIDFVFNMGTLSKFPKFTQAALKNDLEGMKAQYKRYAGGKELKGRNSEFLKRFLAEYFGFNYYF